MRYLMTFAFLATLLTASLESAGQLGSGARSPAFGSGAGLVEDAGGLLGSGN